MKYSPITEIEFLKMLDIEKKTLTENQRKFFEKISVPPYLKKVDSDDISFFVVGIIEDKVLAYDDVKDGFNTYPISESNQILRNRFEQDNLKFAIIKIRPDLV